MLNQTKENHKFQVRNIDGAYYTIYMQAISPQSGTNYKVSYFYGRDGNYTIGDSKVCDTYKDALIYAGISKALGQNLGTTDIIQATHTFTIYTFETYFDVNIEVVDPAGAEKYLVSCKYQNSDIAINMEIVKSYELAITAAEKMIDAHVRNMEEFCAHTDSPRKGES